MGTDLLMFEVHYGGTFDRQGRCTYVGGYVNSYPDVYDVDKLSFIEIQAVCKEYRYRDGDLIYYRLPDKSLDEGLRLISSDHDVQEMVKHHVGHGLVELYLVSYGIVDVDVDVDVQEGDAEEDEDYERDVVFRKDAFWDDVLSEDTDGHADDSDYGGHSLDGEDSTRVGVEESVGDGDDEPNEDVEDRGGEEDEYSSDMARSDILISPIPSDEDDELRSKRSDVTKRVQFCKSDLQNPVLQVGNLFNDANEFRKVVKQANIVKGKDLIFKKNERTRVVAVCKDINCNYRVYGRLLKDESSFILVSLRPRHSCTRRYKNHMINSTWIAEWCIDSFRNQPNMPIDVLQKEVKSRWNVDVHVSSLYRAKKKAQNKIYGKLDEQYHRLWDYCAAVRRTNVGSCLILMVDRPMPQVPCRFQRLYVSLAAMKNGFIAGCRPVIGVDACFLKGMYKGQLMAAVGRDANNNMYPIAMAVVEAETKDSWTWFLETLMGDLGQAGRCGWTFISDRQKVS